MIRAAPDSYRTVSLLLEPDSEQNQLLKENEVSIQKFVGLSQEELWNLLYHGFNQDGDGNGNTPSMRTINLMTRRIINMPKSKTIIPFDEDNSEFIEIDGIWYFRVQLRKKTNGKIPPRINIQIAKTNNRYYEVIDELKDFGFIITRENDKWVGYISIPVTTRSDSKIVGIDFNYVRWVAAKRRGRPLFFDATPYNNEIDRINKLISRYQSRGDDAKLGNLYKKRAAVVKRAHGNFLSAIIQRFGYVTLSIEKIKEMDKMREKKNTKTNSWLNIKTNLRQFVLRAEAKGFEVVEINPQGTTARCHRCYGWIKKYGKHDRLISCDCGLKDYNRDLNAARNIAIRGKNYVIRGGEFKFGRLVNRMEKKVLGQS